MQRRHSAISMHACMFRHAQFHVQALIVTQITQICNWILTSSYTRQEPLAVLSLPQGRFYTPRGPGPMLECGAPLGARTLQLDIEAKYFRFV